MNTELTIQQAAESLNVSCPHMAVLPEQRVAQCNGKGERPCMSHADLLNHQPKSLNVLEWFFGQCLNRKLDAIYDHPDIGMSAGLSVSQE